MTLYCEWLVAVRDKPVLILNEGTSDCLVDDSLMAKPTVCVWAI